MDKQSIVAGLAGGKPGYSIHSRRLLRKRVVIGAAIVILAAVAYLLNKNPTDGEPILMGLFIWMLLYNLLYHRKWAANVLRGQKQLDQIGFPGAILDRHYLDFSQQVTIVLILVTLIVLSCASHFGVFTDLVKALWMLSLTVGAGFVLYRYWKRDRPKG